MVPCNRRFLKPPTCYLPNLGEVAELSVGAPCYSGKTDLDTYYYRFEVPESWRPYFSLPPVWSDERGLSYPMHLMGVRTVRGDGMDRLELVESAASAAWRLLPEDPPHPAQLVMIDDLGVTHGRSAEETNAVLTKACEESYGPKGLVVNEKKVERAEEGRPVEILGIEFCQDGSMRPSAARMAALVRFKANDFLFTNLMASGDENASETGDLPRGFASRVEEIYVNHGRNALAVAYFIAAELGSEYP
eukprot:jgi/Mesvir1/726/Mv17333-RA.1